VRFVVAVVGKPRDANLAAAVRAFSARERRFGGVPAAPQRLGEARR